MSDAYPNELARANHAVAGDARPPHSANHCVWSAARSRHRPIEQQSDETLLVDHGSLYPALQRLEARGWISAVWGTENNRKARFYTLTQKGRKQVVTGTKQWRRLAAAIAGLLGPEEAG